MSQVTKATRRIGNEELIIETGKLAKQANGAVTVTYGETVVFVAATAADSVKDGQDFFPLTVEYKEKSSAAGKFPGGYFKREGRPTEKEILTCRMTDRPLRPLFPEGFFNEVQIIAITFSLDGENEPDILSINGASAALMVSDIPFEGPVGAVRVGRINGQFVANPTHSDREDSDLDLIYVGTDDEIMMIEGDCKELSEADFFAALQFAQTQAREVIAMQRELAQSVGKPKRAYPLSVVRPEVMATAKEAVGAKVDAAISIPGKLERQAACAVLAAEAKAAIQAKHADATDFELREAYHKIENDAVRARLLAGKRMDGRGLQDLRPIHSEVGLYPRVHGSALFQRGETQAIVFATLGTDRDIQEFDALSGGVSEKKFILHYNFPPFSVGETGRFGGTNRREVGHGNLAERSLEPVVPKDFPYAVRLTSEIMESNGSTSMASVCGGTLALLDAGVPIKAPVAGISIGLCTEFDEKGKSKNEVLLTDIIGSEDHYGDMDFKVCGTRTGITGFQLDLKIRGLKFDLAKEALERARVIRNRILDNMEAAIAAPRQELSAHAPRIHELRVPSGKIGAIIGPGGKMIKSITAETGCDINIDDRGDHGLVKIFSNNSEAADRAMEIIRSMTEEVEVGKIYHGTVTGTKEFGAFVEVLPGTEGLCHISELADVRVRQTEDVVKVGDRVWVKVLGIDDRGKIRLSRKQAMTEKSGEPVNA
ncbi:polyribonucleotide nucleotidyltransferase [Oscillatoria amoena NRMC-F 0135]|nr:polyribonucleotide nucleotidyltransferase [Oscillatoria laete-virens]MDL5048658.1 polyribonucleotide nucleotidyltransferase [Oscillatoria amoena NRMC-F 0135]MDL5053249.1 polyribonucleotide nucleotidyltransferase [Oscillatoria laete-virens NRMC-F 0139]